MRDASTNAAKPKRSELRKFIYGMAFILALLVVAACVFEVWRQVTISGEKDKLEEAVSSVHDSIQNGKSYPEYFNSRITGTNGWDAYERALNLQPRDGPGNSTSSLTDMTQWQRAHSVRVGWRDGFPDEEVQTKWLADSDPIARCLSEAAKADVIAYTMRPDAKRQDAYGAGYDYELTVIAVARVELLLKRGLERQAALEMSTLLHVFKLFKEPLDLRDGYMHKLQVENATENLSRMASLYKFSNESLEKIEFEFPKPLDSLLKMLEGELVMTCWEIESGAWGYRKEGWFAWAIDNEESSADFPSRPLDHTFESVVMRRFQRHKIRYLQECISVIRSGKDLMTSLPEPTPIDNPPGWNMHPFDLRQWGDLTAGDIKLRFRRTVLSLRRLELSGPLATQKDKAIALALPGTRITFDGDDCLVSFDASAFPTVRFEYPAENYRLKTLP